MAGGSRPSWNLRRREFLELAAGTFVTALGGGGCGSHDTASGPNVLFIAADDLNDWIGCLGGHPDARTPNIDALADRGVLFTHCYANSPLCNPSRASAMSGLLPSTTGLFENHVPWRAAMPGVVTLPE